MTRVIAFVAAAACVQTIQAVTTQRYPLTNASSQSSTAYTVVGPSPPYTWLFEFPLPMAPKAVPKYTAIINGTAIQYFETTIMPFTKQIYPDLGPAHMIGYNGTTPGPMFRIPVNTEQVVRFTNNGILSSAVHLHGSPTRSPWDGWASDDIDPGQFKDYYYPASPISKTLLYHDHANNHTSVDAYYGQTGVHIFYDPAEEAALGLPTDAYDIALTFSDKQYGSDGDLVSPASERVNFYGDIMHVNNQPWPYFNVEPRRYRFRIVVTGLSRPYGIALQPDISSSAADFTVIGSDAGLFPHPVVTSSLVVSMGERYDIVVDFTPFASSNVTMNNIYENVGTGIPMYVNTDKLMRFVVSGNSTVSSTANNVAIPATLPGVSLDLPPMRTTVDHVFNFQRNSENWTINGVVFDDVAARTLARPPAGTVERWTLNYASGPGVHPIHLHLVDFQILARTGQRALLPYETAGLKDVVLLEPGESADVLAHYGPWNGLYQFHCHNLIHEDHEMMDTFNVTALEALGYDDVFAFDDPMDTRFAAKDIDAKYYTADYILNTLLPGFVNSAAYSKMAAVVDAEAQYYMVNPYGEGMTSTAIPSMTGLGAQYQSRNGWSAQTASAARDPIQSANSYKASSQTVDGFRASSQTVDGLRASSQTVDAFRASSQTTDAFRASSQTTDAFRASSQTTDAFRASSQTTDAFRASSQTVAAYKASTQPASTLKPTQTADAGKAATQFASSTPKISTSFGKASSTGKPWWA